MAPRSSAWADQSADDVWRVLAKETGSDQDRDRLAELRLVVETNREEILSFAETYENVNPVDLERETAKLAWHVRVKFPTGFSWAKVAPLAQDMARDLNLGSRYSRGEKDAFGELQRWYEPAVIDLLRQFHFSVEDEKDVCQIVFMKAWVGRESFEPGRCFRTYLLCGIAKNAAMDHKRKLARRREVNLSEGQDNNIPDPKPPSSENLPFSEELRAVMRAHLDDRDIRLLSARFFPVDSKPIPTFETLGVEYGVVASTVKRWVDDALKKLREPCGDLWYNK